MDFDFAYLRIIGKLLIQFNTIGFHNFYDIGLLQAMGKSIVKVRINQCDQLVVLQKKIETAVSPEAVSRPFGAACSGLMSIQVVIF